MEVQKTAAALTLGCKVNFYETEAMLALFENAGYKIVDFSERADVYIINTCTVTNLGDKKSRQMIRRAASSNPCAIIAAVGCYVQSNTADAAAINGVDILIGTKERGKIVEIVEAYEKHRGVEIHVEPYSGRADYEELSVAKLQDRQRAFIKIQDGCDRYCAYCAIPYARGPIRSRAPGDVINEIQSLAANGYKEVVLSGIHLSSYGRDNGASLFNVISGISEITGIERIRLGSLEPTAMSDEFIKLLASVDKLCDHFHLSLQSGCDKTLKRMNRRYDINEYEQSVLRLRKYFPEVSVTTDVITGFPGESDKDFEDSYSFCERMEFSKLHVFPFSRKKGTKAYDMNGQIKNAVKSARAAQLISLSEVLEKFYRKKFENKKMPVLFERNIGNNNYTGYTTNYLPVTVKSDVDISGMILPAVITAD